MDIRYQTLAEMLIAKIRKAKRYRDLDMSQEAAALALGAYLASGDDRYDRIERIARSNGWQILADPIEERTDKRPI